MLKSMPEARMYGSNLGHMAKAAQTPHSPGNWKMRSDDVRREATWQTNAPNPYTLMVGPLNIAVSGDPGKSLVLALVVW